MFENHWQSLRKMAAKVSVFEPNKNRQVQILGKYGFLPGRRLH
jgi:hypothetical protein